MVLLVLSLQDQVEKYGAYVGIAAFFGLAVLSLLYFAQAREVKRLREWAGRAPERAAELEQAVAEHAEEVLRTPVPAPQPVAEPQPAAVAVNGAGKLKPEEVAALAFARAAGIHAPHAPKPQPVPAATVAVAAPPARTVEPAPAAVAAPAVSTAEPVAAQAPAPATNGGGGTPPPPPPPVTPAARRAEPAPLPPRRTAPPSRRAAPPPRRESNTRAVVLTAVIGVLVLAGTAFAVTSLLGRDDDAQPKPPNELPAANEDGEATATAAAPTKETALVMVFNGTATEGLASRYRDQLAQEGYPAANLEIETLAEAEQRQTSVVMFRRGSKAAADEVASALGIEQVDQLDATTQSSLAGLPEAKQKDWNVVAIIGVDKSTQ